MLENGASDLNADLQADLKAGLKRDLNPRVIGFDFGLKRIGVAAGNRLTGSCQALTRVRAHGGAPNWSEVEGVIAAWQPGVLVVGLPLHMGGGEGDMAAKARVFGARLRRRFHLEVAFVDERLSSVGADELLARAAPPGKSLARRREKHRDSLAAELILSAYLETNRG